MQVTSSDGQCVWQTATLYSFKYYICILWLAVVFFYPTYISLRLSFWVSSDFLQSCNGYCASVGFRSTSLGSLYLWRIMLSCSGGYYNIGDNLNVGGGVYLWHLGEVDGLWMVMFSDQSTSPSICNTRLVHDGPQMQTEAVAIVFVILEHDWVSYALSKWRYSCLLTGRRGSPNYVDYWV